MIIGIYNKLLKICPKCCWALRLNSEVRRVGVEQHTPFMSGKLYPSYVIYDRLFPMCNAAQKLAKSCSFLFCTKKSGVLMFWFLQKCSTTWQTTFRISTVAFLFDFVRRYLLSNDKEISDVLRKVSFPNLCFKTIFDN